MEIIIIAWVILAVAVGVLGFAAYNIIRIVQRQSKRKTENLYNDEISEHEKNDSNFVETDKVEKV